MTTLDPTPGELPPTARDPAPRVELTPALLASLAKAELVRMAREGELGPARVWVAMKGASKYLAAVAAGDVAGEDRQGRRLATCRGCPWRTVRAVTLPTLTVDVWHCGEPFVEHLGPEVFPGSRVCGCLVGISVHGEMVDRAAGKVVVGSESCPQGRWGAGVIQP